MIYYTICALAVFVIACGEAAHIIVRIRERREARRIYRMAVRAFRQWQEDAWVRF